MNDPNLDILIRHHYDIAEVAEHYGTQAGIDYANSLIDPRLGIVAGDGAYYPRAGFPEY